MIPPMIRKHRAAGIAAGIAIAVFWGVSFLSTKIAVAAIPPMTLALLRFIGATAILAILKRALAPGDKIRGKDVPALAAAGLIGVTAYFLMENNGIKLMTASEASVTIAFIPVMSLMAERLLLKTRLSALQYAGALLSTLGVYVLVSSGLSLESDLRGYLFMFGAGLSWVVYSFITRGLFAVHQRITVVFWQSLFGTLGFIPFALAESPAWTPASAPVWLHVAFLARSLLGPGLLALRGLRRHPGPDGLIGLHQPHSGGIAGRGFRPPGREARGRCSGWDRPSCSPASSWPRWPRRVERKRKRRRPTRPKPD